MLTSESRRSNFPSLAGRAYLNTAAEGIPPACVLESLIQYAQDKLIGMDGRALHEAQWTRAKAGVAALLGLTPDEVTLCSCSSEAYNLAAAALGLGPDDEVVITDLDFPSGVTPYLLQKSRAAARIWRSRSDGALHIEDLRALLSHRTRLVQVSAVSFYNGYRLDLAAVRSAVRELSPALFSVDVTQGLCRVPLDLEDCDLVVSSTHKWLLATHGGGIVGIPARSESRLTVPAGGWFNLEDPFSPERFDRSAEPRPGAAGFTVGMPNYPAIYAVAAASDYMLKQDVRRIDAYASPLVQHCLTELRRLPGIDLITPIGSGPLAGILAFRHPRSEQLHAYLHARNVHVMFNAGRLRVSIHGYNSAEDVEAFLRALREALEHA